jgi:hypothetical protein
MYGWQTLTYTCIRLIRPLCIKICSSCTPFSPTFCSSLEPLEAALARHLVLSDVQSAPDRMANRDRWVLVLATVHPEERERDGGSAR